MSAGRLLPISVSIIVRDEERDLPGAVESVPFAKEIVVVDSGSVDRTREVARLLDRPERPVLLFERAWTGHVDQKNFALEQAREEWILCLDADERVGSALRSEIDRLFADGRGAAGPRADGYTVGRRTFYLGRWMDGNGWYPDRKLRLVRRGRARWRGTDPHDRLEVDGAVERLEGDLDHLSYRDLSDHLRKLDLFTDISARGKLGRPPRWPALRMLVHPPARFIKMYLLRRGWRDGVPGVIAAGMGALYAFLKYAKLWERLQEERRLRGAASRAAKSARAGAGAGRPSRPEGTG